MELYKFQDKIELIKIEKEHAYNYMLHEAFDNQIKSVVFHTGLELIQARALTVLCSKKHQNTMENRFIDKLNELARQHCFHGAIGRFGYIDVYGKNQVNIIPERSVEMPPPDSSILIAYLGIRPGKEKLVNKLFKKEEIGRHVRSNLVSNRIGS